MLIPSFRYSDCVSLIALIDMSGAELCACLDAVPASDPNDADESCPSTLRCPVYTRVLAKHSIVVLEAA